MIGIFLKLTNPFKHSPWRSIYQGSWIVSENKTLEVEVSRYAYYLFELNLDLSWRGKDHAGPEFGLNILGWDMRIALVDHRHWDGVTGWWAN